MKYPPYKESAITQIWDMTERMRAVPNKGMDTPQDDAGIRVWWVHAPWMAPLQIWHWHYVALIHLRDLPGQTKPATIRVPGATHELMAFAMNPALPVDPQAELGPPPPGQFLSPHSLCQQFKADSDAEALDMVECCLDLCVAGRLTLESEGRRAWAHLLTECEHMHEHKGRAS